jgi:Tfp pilus assembly protein PilZ
MQLSPQLRRTIKESREPGQGGSLVVPVGAAVRVGRTVVVEFDVGGEHDSVTLAGIVASILTTPDGSRRASLRIVPSHRHRVSYLADLARGTRHATKRAHRRHVVRFEARIHRSKRIIPAAVQSVSEGGVFVRSHVCAEVGKSVDLDILLPGEGHIRVASDVRWGSADPRRVGFGASFAEGQDRVLQTIARTLARLAPRADERLAPT